MRLPTRLRPVTEILYDNYIWEEVVGGGREESLVDVQKVLLYFMDESNSSHLPQNLNIYVY